MNMVPTGSTNKPLDSYYFGYISSIKTIVVYYRYVTKIVFAEVTSSLVHEFFHVAFVNLQIKKFMYF